MNPEWVKTEWPDWADSGHDPLCPTQPGDRGQRVEDAEQSGDPEWVRSGLVSSHDLSGASPPPPYRGRRGGIPAQGEGVKIPTLAGLLVGRDRGGPADGVTDALPRWGA